MDMPPTKLRAQFLLCMAALTVCRRRVVTGTKLYRHGAISLTDSPLIYRSSQNSVCKPLPTIEYVDALKKA